MPDWFSRMFTLPKSRNSLADIMGESGAKVAVDLVRGIVKRGLTDSIGPALAADIAAGEDVVAKVHATVERAIGDVPAPFHDILEGEIDRILSVPKQDPAQVTDLIVARILALLGL